MTWDEDIDLVAGKKSAPKQGRRAGILPKSSGSDSTDDVIESAEEIFSPIHKSGGWEEDASKATTKGKPSSANIIEQARFREEEESPELEEEIPEIPDLDESPDDAPFSPKFTMSDSSRMSTYRELDDQIAVQDDLNTVGGINLSLLTQFIPPNAPRPKVEEAWTKESLIKEFMERGNRKQSRQQH